MNNGFNKEIYSRVKTSPLWDGLNHVPLDEGVAVGPPHGPYLSKRPSSPHLFMSKLTHSELCCAWRWPLACRALMLLKIVFRAASSAPCNPEALLGQRVSQGVMQRLRQEHE